MRQPEAIRADIRGAEANIKSKNPELTTVDAQIAAIQARAPQLERAVAAGKAALSGIDRGWRKEKFLPLTRG
jgi:hypothetical protein